MTCRDKFNDHHETRNGDVDLDGKPPCSSSTNVFRSRWDFSDPWLALRHASFLSSIMLIPVLHLSGELSHISEDSYILDVTSLWRLVIFSGIVNGAHLVTASMLSTVTTPVVTSFLAMPTVSIQLVIFAFGSFTQTTWIGVVSCGLSSICFIVAKIRETLSSQSPKARNACILLRAIMMILGACVGTVGIARLTWEHHLSPPGATPSCGGAITLANEPNFGRHSRPSISRNDDYLGARPHVDAVADIPLILERCYKADDDRGVEGVANCLSFLADKVEEYIYLPNVAGRNYATKRNLQGLVDVDANRGNSTSRAETLETTAPGNTVSTCGGPIIPFHVYWTGPASWRFELFVKAYLHTQNLACSRLHIWLDSDKDSRAVEEMLCSDPIFARFLPLVSRGDIVLKTWTFPHRIHLPKAVIGKDIKTYTSPSQSHPYHSHLGDLETTITDNVIHNGTDTWLTLNPASTRFSPVQVSDAVRFIILHLHGGVYLDMDVLLLRDMRPLLLPHPTTSLTRPFAEQWVEGCPASDYNTAVLSLPANSSLSTYLLRGGVRMGMNFHPRVIGRMLWRDGRNEELAMLHNAVFDPLVTDQRRKNTKVCTVPCHKNWESAFMRNVDDPEQEWRSFEGEPGNVVEGSWPPTNRSLGNFFRGAWAYHIHNQVRFGTFSFNVGVGFGLEVMAWKSR